MSPEQVQAEPAGVGPASDVYSLGVILYELLSGRVPYDATSVSLHRAIVTILLTEPPPLGSVVPALRGPTERVVMMALEKAPRHRYRDARELGDDLRCRLEGRTVRARGPGLARRIVSWSRRQQRLAATLAIAVMAGAIALAWVFGGGGRVPRERVLASYREAEELMVSAVPLLYERERTPDTMREVIDRLTRARTLVDAVPPLSHHDFLIRHLEKDLGTAQMLLGELTWDVGAARQACVSFGRARSLAVRDDPAQFRDKQLPELVPEAVPEGDLLGLLAGANLLCYRLWGELATIESARDFARQAYEERLRDLERAPGRLGPGGQGLVDRVAHAWNARAEIAMETAWFYRDAAVARQAVAWSDSARSRWASFGDNWPALGSVLFESARARRAEGALTRDIRPLEAAEQSLRACADYRGPGRPRVFAETREERAALARDRAALEPDPTRAARLLLGALHDLDTARVALRSANATPEQRAALRSAEAEVLAALARVTRAPAWLDSARARLTETSGAFPHTGFPRQASLHWMRLGLLEVARADVNSDHTAIAAARGAFEHARSLARNRRDQAIIARVDEAEKSLDRLPAGSAGGR
jgi:hypothetical protein